MMVPSIVEQSYDQLETHKVVDTGFSWLSEVLCWLRHKISCKTLIYNAPAHTGYEQYTGHT